MAISPTYNPWFWVKNGSKYIFDFSLPYERARFELPEKHKITEFGPPKLNIQPSKDVHILIATLSWCSTYNGCHCCIVLVQLNYTHDPIADFINAVQSDIISFASKRR